jgi:hypothetical protein
MAMTASLHALPQVMDVLDRADAEVAHAAARTRLLTLAQATGTTHAPAVLARAVDAHLAGPIPTGAAPSAPFDFGWDRPVDATDQARREARRGWRRLSRLAHSVPGVVVVFLGPIAPMVHFIFTTLAPTTTDAQTIVGLGAVALSFFASMGLTLTCFGLARHCEAALPFQDELPRDITAYLQHARSRAYVRALLASGLPALTHGDIERLEAIFKEEQALAEKESARLNAARAQIAHIPTLIQALAALDGPPQGERS